uniref:Uncharacterized protein n=1 Tax=Trichuris muris TaxID=70415 RepID=A0A5S6QP57_TRIMR
MKNSRENIQDDQKNGGPPSMSTEGSLALVQNLVKPYPLILSRTIAQSREAAIVRLVTPALCEDSLNSSA